MIRRQHGRRSRRLKKVFRLLKINGLLPDKEITSQEDRQDFVNELDRAILSSSWFSAKVATLAISDPMQVMPYILRAMALDEPLDPFHFGRALFHLAQRRGFETNRKQRAETSKDKEEEEGAVKSGISELQKAMEASGARTLGEYFFQLDTRKERIRKRWTARAMYKDEFEKIWDAQARFHPSLLTAEKKKEIQRAIFFQRKLKAQKYLIGRCELEPGEQRAPAYLLCSQRFRLLQKINDLRIFSNGAPERHLSLEEREKLLHILELQGDQTFPAIRELLGLPKTAHFNLSEGGETRIPGNRTASQLHSVFGGHWLAMSEPERDQVVEYLNNFERSEKLADAARKKWNLGEEADRFAAVTLEADYLAYSKLAMKKLLPTLEEGGSLQDAIFNAYGQNREKQEVLDALPPVDRWREIRNPGVMRSLSELRKVVNAIVHQHGKPMEIRIELARDLRQTKAQRERAWKKNRGNQREREKAAKTILDEVGLARPSGEDIRKVLLAKECHFTCPYTGRAISMTALVGRESQFDIEHIIPFSRSLDNSFANLTLCYHEENRNVKRNQTPMEAYGSGSDRFQEILSQVKRFRSDFAREKLRKFQMTTMETAEALEKFTTRQLNDTRYATRLAGDYLSLLYGGRVDSNGKLRIRATAGQVTAFLRDEWKLNAILQDGSSSNGGASKKSRDDHRHHAVDAVVTALTDDGTIQSLSRAAERAPLERRRRFAAMPGPWPNFVSSVRTHIESIVVSHRPQKKVSGALHEETFYGVPKGNGGGNVRHVRKPIGSLSVKEINDIVDSRVKEIVLAKMRELGTDDPASAFADPKNFPYFEASGGRQIPIKSARIRKKLATFPVGAGRAIRHVASESNHHVEIFAELDRDSREIEWDARVVTLAEAYKRKKEKTDVINRNHGSMRQFKFSLSPGEIVECDGPGGTRRLLVVRSTSIAQTGQIQIALVPVADARMKKEIVSGKQFLRPGPNTLRQWNTIKVAVSPLGEVSEAHD